MAAFTNYGLSKDPSVNTSSVSGAQCAGSLLVKLPVVLMYMYIIVHNILLIVTSQTFNISNDLYTFAGWYTLPVALSI